MAEVTCPLCDGDECSFLYHSDDRHGLRRFFECVRCDLAFVPPEFHLPERAEIDRYMMHDNDPHDQGYRRFLSRLWNELRPLVSRDGAGLDFGCGPGPALAHMMRSDGFDVSLYDPYFFPNEAVLRTEYSFITCTETVEHLRTPAETFTLLDAILLPGGVLGVMTGMLEDRSEFSSWYYQRDPTHIAFYRRQTMQWISARFGWSVEFPAVNVTIFRKPSSP